jgi:uncharacterized membrane protein YqjE
MAHKPESDDLREASLGDLAKRLSSDMSTLVRQELELARVEMTQKGRQAGGGLGLIGVGGAIGLAALGALTAFALLVLATFLDAWLAALLVAVALGAVAAALALRGKERVQEVGTPLPDQAKESVNEDMQWAKTQIGSDKR